MWPFPDVSSTPEWKARRQTFWTSAIADGYRKKEQLKQKQTRMESEKKTSYHGRRVPQGRSCVWIWFCIMLAPFGFYFNFI